MTKKLYYGKTIIWKKPYYGKTILWKNYIMEKTLLWEKLQYGKNYGTMPNTMEL